MPFLSKDLGTNFKPSNILHSRMERVCTKVSSTATFRYNKMVEIQERCVAFELLDHTISEGY